jgi:ketosteroid isomerase-like protein
MDASTSAVHATLAAINQAWRQKTPDRMAPYLHPDIVMTFPRFQGTVSGRATFIEGFKEFCANAKVLEYSESDEQILVIGSTAVASFRFSMTYERATYRERSTGRDLWVFQYIDGNWKAVWRTMMDLTEERTPVVHP